ncbi:MAG: hypothetical protein KAJ51_13530 [Thermoplasmata archaeon]|nr:hypothetical protein [Thermoplasmata archaeon]
MITTIRKPLVLFFISVLIFFQTLPLAAGDGMPAIQYGEQGGDPQAVFSSIFESRQLATVELIDESHERISLFLSVYSLDPGANLTILVPLRTLPSDVTGKPLKETEFRDEYKITRAEREIIRQDMGEAMDKFGTETTDYFQYAFGSCIWTFLGEYTRQEIHRIEYDNYYGDEKGDSGTLGGEYGEPEPVQHYEFDGFSIDVFNVSSGPVLTDYLEDKGLILPESDVFQRYNNQYVAVIESATKPPISETEFQYLQKYVPNSTSHLIEELKTEPARSARQIRYLKWDLHDHIRNEFREESVTEVNRYELQDYMDNLVDAVFTKADFEGEVLEIELPLDNGKMFFPLGTSGGWPNTIGDIDILFKVPENKALDIPHSKDAYFEDAHWHLFQVENSNPDYDLESTLKSSDSSAKSEMERAAFISDNFKELAFVIILIIFLLSWFGVAYSLKIIHKKKNERVLRNPKLWLFLILAFALSVPGAILLYLIIKPIPLKKLTHDLLMVTLLVFYPVSALLFTLGVSL